MYWNRMRSALLRGVCLAAIAISALATAQDSALEKRVDLYLRDADLLTATEMLSRQTGLQFVIASSDKEFKLITLSLTDRTAMEAIRYICDAAGGYAERDENGVFVIRIGAKPTKPTEEPAPKVKKPNATRKIELQSADAKDIYDQLMDRLVFDEMSGLMQVQKANRLAPTGPQFQPGSLTVITPGNFAPTSYPISAPSQLNTPKNGNQTGGPIPESGSGILLPEAAPQIGPGGSPGAGGQQGGQNGQGLTAGQGLVPEGITYIGYDPTDNSIVVVGPDEAVRQLQQNIALFDVPPKQVIIEVQFVTTSNSLDTAFGIDWQYQRGAVNAGNRPGSFVRAGDPIFLNYATGNVVARLRTLLTNGTGRVVSAPKIRTLNNQFAIVQQSVQTTIFINQIVNGPGGVITVPQPVPFPVTTALAVRPRINRDGTITVNLTPQIQDLGGVRRGPDGQEIPDVLSQFLNVVARVKDGETIVLAGLTRKSDRSSFGRYPVLGDLPIIGQFFKSKTRALSNEELLIFVTPRVVQEGQTGLETGP